MTHPPEEWHYGRKIPKNVRTDDDPHSHGSCVASKAAGVVNGVSKKSHLVILKIDNTAPNVIWGFNTALDDIVARKRQGRAVIAYPNVAIGPTPPGLPPYPWNYAHSYLQDLFRNDVPVVVPSGNFASARGRPVDTLPATMERATDPEFPLIVTGSVNNDGALADFSQGPNHVTIWSPGVDIRCAAKGSPRGVQEVSGTSFSTGTVCKPCWKENPTCKFKWFNTMTGCRIPRLYPRLARCTIHGRAGKDGCERQSLSAGCGRVAKDAEWSKRCLEPREWCSQRIEAQHLDFLNPSIRLQGREKLSRVNKCLCD